MAKLSKATCLALLFLGLACFSAEARVRVNIYDFGLFPYHTTQWHFLLWHFFNSLNNTTLAAGEKEKGRLAVQTYIARFPTWKSAQLNIYVVAEECELIPLCETEPQDFNDRWALKKATRWMAGYTDFYLSAMNFKSDGKKIPFLPTQHRPWRKGR